MGVFWCLLVAMGCYTGLAIWRFAISGTHPGAQYLAIPFIGMAIWLAASLFASPAEIALGEFLRDAGWLVYFQMTIRSNSDDRVFRRSTTLFCLGLAALMLMRAGASYWVQFGDHEPATLRGIELFSVIVRWILAALGLLFVNSIYRSTGTAAGSGFRLIMFALGMMWAYNLNLFTMMMLGYPQAMMLAQLRGVVAFILVPAFAIGARRNEKWKVALSRQATTQSLLFAVVGLYFVVISSATRAAIWAGESTGDTLKIILAGGLTVCAFCLALMPRQRAYVKTFLIKHLFAHRYDYRSEWLRFSATIGDRGASLLPPEERAIRSLADVTESRGGVLLLAEPTNKLVLSGAWKLSAPGLAGPPKPVNSQWLASLIDTARILNLDKIRLAGGPSEADGAVPAWLVDELDLWIAVPLVRSQRLVGIVALGHPSIARELDWEDFDLLKVIAQQVTVHLTDAQSHSMLEESRRFDEFNRRFAFIIHDLKNVVSQLSLVSSNAQEHAANPKFQVSMVKTLGNATDKMTTLLARLSAGPTAAEPTLGSVRTTHVLQRLMDESRWASSISISSQTDCVIWADEDYLVEALGHLLSNAIDASPANAEVQLSAAIVDGMAVLAVSDQGCGMSPNFIRYELYKPFASTKPDGFGIGAAEARAMIGAIGGELQVESKEGEGTRFSAVFPLYE